MSTALSGSTLESKGTANGKTHFSLLFRASIGILALGFAACLSVGLVTPCMALQVETDMLYKPVGPLQIKMRGMVDPMVGALLNADVNIVECMQALLRWIGEGEIVSLFVLILYAIFVILLSVLDVVLLCGIAFGILPNRLFPIAKVLKKLSMLDVAIMGVVVVCFSAQIYKKNGVIVSTRGGLLVLLGAELAHYAIYYLVACSAHVASSDVDQEESPETACDAAEELLLDGRSSS